ncbi:conserved hypothetical protein [Hyphomicrobiales bacterium]|nr:conserved hypothetical protein [Hyphomicrobiales bacterium]CAH1677198.1 conserved hypothetical protein [Hyphomicrobiales bacterium]
MNNRNDLLSTTKISPRESSAESFEQQMVGTFAVPELPEALRDSFSACEMQVTVAGAMGRDLAENHLGDILAPQLLDPGSALRRVMQFTQLTVDADVLRDKLNALSPEALAILQSRIGAMFKEYSPVELFASGYLPAIDMLRVAGLVAPAGKAAWGLCNIVLEDENWFVYQIALGSDPRDLPESPKTADRIAEALALAVRLGMEQVSGIMDQLICDLAHMLARSTGCRYLRVHQNGGGARIEEIPVQALRGDAARGELGGLVLEGVNAPITPFPPRWS